MKYRARNAFTVGLEKIEQAMNKPTLSDLTMERLQKIIEGLRAVPVNVEIKVQPVEKHRLPRLIWQSSVSASAAFGPAEMVAASRSRGMSERMGAGSMQQLIAGVQVLVDAPASLIAVNA